MKSLGLALLRGTFGGFMIGHGAQKLFGAFEGGGIEGTAQFMESLNLKPGRQWGAAAGVSEFGGGILTALGLFEPMGPLLTIGSMGMATQTAHKDKPVWVTAGGAELPVTNLAIALALMIAGPGKLSLDELLGTGLPRWLAVPGLAAVGVAIYAATHPDEAQQWIGQLTDRAGGMAQQATSQVQQRASQVRDTAQNVTDTAQQVGEQVTGSRS